MKKLLLILAFVLFSFGSKGATDIENLYKNYKIYQNSGFHLDENKTFEFVNSVSCIVSIKIMVSEGFALCLKLKGITKQKPNDLVAKSIRELSANEEINFNQAIMSFINYAEKFPEFWKEHYSLHRNKFLSEKFPCRED